MSTPEALLNTLRKLDANKACANCDAVAKFGHGNICEKFKTFVCNHCKSAHQSYSHRVKSVTMSNWSKDEVDALKDENGGGNAVARRMWFATWEEGRSMRKPAETDPLDNFKKFINAVYNDKAYYSASPSGGGAPRTSSGRPPKQASAPPKAAPSSDLLGFAGAPTPAFDASFDAFSAPVAPPASASATFAPFDAFAAPVAPTNAPKHDEWSAFQSAPAPPSAATTSFDPFGLASPPASQPPTATVFDPFAAATNNAVHRPSHPSLGVSTMAPPMGGMMMGGGGGPMGGMVPGMSPMGGMHAPSPMVGMHQFNNTMPQFNGISPYNGAAPQMGGFQNNVPTNMYAGGGASISSLLDPNMVSNPHIQRLSGNPNIGYGQPQQQQQRVQAAVVSSGGRDPFAGLGFK
ncbi:Aste57867_3284 [Aphanomyces stellatus]|uniref:Aste57867_3284 protein n=1 Tax=Aphanomyces stellatus TaxID=120398 RepID=A0A485K9C4_9STRA|nr:hypothetical protein As57867_003274 [Aphanomyces stellatus]VFT80455.1 Aste57867_3284 [Aphanomyces stellatus]